jgi:hypothetical protein
MKPQSASPGSPHWVRTLAAPFPPLGPPRRVPQLPRYYGAVRLPGPLTSDSVAFGRRYPALLLSFRSRRSRWRDRGPGVRHRSPIPVISRREASRASQVPEESLCAYALFFDPGRSNAPGHAAHRHGPRYVHGEGNLPQLPFGAQSHGLGTRCLRFVGWIAPPPRKTRFPLLANSTGRDWLPAGFQ